MGNYILCKQPLSKSPFHIRSVHLNIYSLEELCYFLSNNLPLANEVIADSNFLKWLKDESVLGLSVKEYEKINEPEGKISDHIIWIFSKSHYFTENEMRTLKYKMRALDAMTPAKRQKRLGDVLIKNGKYKKGIACYEQIFSVDGMEEEPASFAAGIYYNMGVACENMFLSAKAADYFHKAYECEKTSANRNAYLIAVYFDSGRSKMSEEARKLGANEGVVLALLDVISKIRPYDMPDDRDAAIDEWIREYHRSVDQ